MASGSILKSLLVQQVLVIGAPATLANQAVRLGEMQAALDGKQDAGSLTLVTDEGVVIQVRAKLGDDGQLVFYGVTAGGDAVGSVRGDSTTITADNTEVTGDRT